MNIYNFLQAKLRKLTNTTGKPLLRGQLNSLHNSGKMGGGGDFNKGRKIVTSDFNLPRVAENKLELILWQQRHFPRYQFNL